MKAVEGPVGDGGPATFIKATPPDPTLLRAPGDCGGKGLCPCPGEEGNRAGEKKRVSVCCEAYHVSSRTGDRQSRIDVGNL